MIAVAARLEALFPQSVDSLVNALNFPQSSVIADVGCHGWRLSRLCQQRGYSLVGFDRAPPPGMPGFASFRTMIGSALEGPSDVFSLVVASHVIEHLIDPVAAVSEMARVVQPGGYVWIESPSELSCTTAGSDAPEDHTFSNFWDDPTHQRPYSPGAMYRLALSCALYPLQCGRVDEGIPCTRLVAYKPLSVKGTYTSRYVTLRDVPRGAEAAWKHVWPEFALN